jgi:hypothetical protein
MLRERRVDLVFGLHCCGGLAEAAVELALTLYASFCVSTCCFPSNPHLASLSKRADDAVAIAAKAGKANKKILDDGSVLLPTSGMLPVPERQKADRTLVAALAVTVGAEGQHRAMRAINAMRLTMAESHFSGDAEGKSTRLITTQRSFPASMSVQNRILVGTVQPTCLLGE